MGQLIGIAFRTVKRGPMLTVNEVELTRAAGVEGDFRGRPGPRQVTVLAKESWREACSEVGTQLEWTTRRANLLIEGIALQSTTGKLLRIGDALLGVTGETAPCSRMEEACPGLRRVLKPLWRGGVTCQVKEGGRIRSGDPVELLEADEVADG